MSEPSTVMSEGQVTLQSICPGCGEPIPVTVTVRVLVCECGVHQVIDTAPDLTDVAAHLWTHQEQEAEPW